MKMLKKFLLIFFLLCCWWFDAEKTLFTFAQNLLLCEILACFATVFQQPFSVLIPGCRPHFAKRLQIRYFGCRPVPKMLPLYGSCCDKQCWWFHQWSGVPGIFPEWTFLAGDYPKSAIFSNFLHSCVQVVDSYVVGCLLYCATSRLHVCCNQVCWTNRLCSPHCGV